MWRHLIVIALEDVGVAGMDLVERVVAAGRNRTWRKKMGGEWAVASFLVRKMAESNHCQAACDLLLRAKNCSSLEQARADAIDADPADLIQQLGGLNASLEARGVAALALIGELADDLRPANAAAIFDVLASQGYSTDVVETCRSAWRSTRNPMALLLPLIWQPWTSGEQHRVQDDEVPPSQMIAGVPSYAVDQFTRSGGQVARAYLRRDYAMRSLLDAAFVPRGQWPRAIGDLIFLNEGSCLIRRAIWPLGEKLRQPQRALLHAIGLGDHLTVALDHLDANRPVIASLRSYHLQLGL